jgi:hypothetical protein
MIVKPSDQTSDCTEYVPLLGFAPACVTPPPDILSGAIYDWHPIFVLAILATRFPLTPKSQIFTCPRVLTRILVGLTSRWIMLCTSFSSFRPLVVAYVIFRNTFSGTPSP